MTQVVKESKTSRTCPDMFSSGVTEHDVELVDRDYIITRFCTPVMDSFDDIYETGFHLSRHIGFSRHYIDNDTSAICWISDKLKKNEFTLRYTLKEQIDEGTYAKVYKCVPNSTPNVEYAVKVMNKSQMQALGLGPYIQREIEILHRVKNNPNVCTLVDFVETSTHYYLVMELLSGGSLDREFHSFEEREYKAYIYQLALALQHLHNNGIFHADVQLGNICKCTRDDASLSVRLVDFGLSDYVSTSREFKRHVGNLYYASPEMVNGDGYNGPEVDVWALGVCLFKLATGYRPFKNSDCIREGKFMIPLEEEDEVSDDCKDLICKILQVDPLLRLTIDDVLNHPFFDDCKNRV